ncbi:MAG: AAA family ATPase [Gammaproteobacteria bacterium]|nr:MAG: AAA family ATPase [Gammaproteobacteria bacterium]
MISAVLAAANKVILGKDHQLRLALSCLLAQGNLLIEDLPGMGKTTLSQVLARVLGLGFNRVQFTSDLLPADIIGVSIFQKESGQFEFSPGPIFAQLILADEINRATPKTQSALLEAMEEHQVTVDGKTRPLPNPFFVIATQNPMTQMGTFPLPESQLDRFLMRINIGYPDPTAERELLLGRDRRSMLDDLEPVVTLEQLLALQAQATDVHLASSVIDYIQRLVQYTRDSGDFFTGLSPRGALALLRASQAWALIEGRDHVIPEDIQAVVPAVVEHRVRGAADHIGHGGIGLTEHMLASVEVVA